MTIKNIINALTNYMNDVEDDNTIIIYAYTLSDDESDNLMEWLTDNAIHTNVSMDSDTWIVEDTTLIIDWYGADI